MSSHKANATAERNGSNGVKVWAQGRGAPRLPYSLAESATSNGAILIFTQRELECGDQMMVGFFIDDPEDADRFGTDFAGVERFIRTFYPEAELIAYDIHSFVEDEWSGFGDWIAYKPGRISRSHSELSKPEGRLYFATADIAHTFLAWIEGAVEMGKKAAVDAQRLMTREAIAAEVRVHAKV